MTRDEVVTLARGWTGTPYHRGASCRLGGCDCAGLIVGLWQQIYGRSLALKWGASGFLFDEQAAQKLAMVLEIHLVKQPERHGRLVHAPGDIALFGMGRNRLPLHLGVLTGPDRFLHASEKHKVAEVYLSGNWQKRMKAVYSFPGVK